MDQADQVRTGWSLLKISNAPLLHTDPLTTENAETEVTKINHMMNRFTSPRPELLTGSTMI